MITDDELKNIELWRNAIPVKHIVMGLLSIKNKLLQEIGEPALALNCFCSSGSIKPYHTAWYIWYDQK